MGSVFALCRVESASISERKYTQTAVGAHEKSARNAIAPTARRTCREARLTCLFTIVGGSVLINPAFAQQAGCGRSARGRRHRHACIARDRRRASSCNADTFVDLDHRDRTSARFPTSRSPKRCSGCPASRSRACSRATTAITSRPEPATVLIRGLTFVRTRVQRPRQLLGRRLSRPQLQRRLARAHGRRRLVQEPDRGDDRGRHRRRRQPAHAHAVRRATARRSR